MKRLTKRVMSAFLALALVVTALAGGSLKASASTNDVTSGSYDVSATLYKEEACTNVSMGNSGIDSISADFNGDGTVDITLVSKTVFYSNTTGQLSAFTLYDSNGNAYVGDNSANSLSFVISGFPASDFQVNSVLRGTFVSVVSMPIPYHRS